MTLNQIDEQMAILAKRERKITREVLELVRRAEACRLPESLGYKDTYDWLIRRHGYSGSAANRRVQASRLLKDLPEVAQKVENGSLNLTTLCQMQTVMRAQQKATGHKATVQSKRQALGRIENKTSSEAEKELHTLFPEVDVTKERVVNRRDGGQLCTIALSKEAVALLERSRELLSHAMPSASIGDVIERLAREFVNKNDPLLKRSKTATMSRAHADKLAKSSSVPLSKCNTARAPTDAAVVTTDIVVTTSNTARMPADTVQLAQPAAAPVERREKLNINNLSEKMRDPTTGSKFIPAQVRRFVLQQAGGQCEYTHLDRRCTSRYRLEIDHIIPKAKGGTDQPSNLRCLCRRHNQFMAERELGREFMKSRRAISEHVGYPHKNPKPQNLIIDYAIECPDFH